MGALGWVVEKHNYAFPPSNKAALPAHAKAAKVSLDGLCRCVVCGGLLRRAALERNRACLASGRTARQCVASLSGQRSPTSITCHRRRY